MVARSLVIFTLAMGACSEPDRASEPLNVLWITIDTLRADHLGAYGYSRSTSPAIDELAERGTRFERAYSTAPWTLPSIVSMLTGRLPSEHGVDTVKSVLPRNAASAPRQMRDAGYATGGVVSGGFLRRTSGIAHHFDLWDDSHAQGMAYSSTPGVVEASRAMLAELALTGQPFLLFTHFFDPHYRYNDRPDLDFAPRRGKNITGMEPYQKIRSKRHLLGERDIELLTGLYDEEIRFADGGVALLLAELDALGLRESTLVAVTADHGEELMDRGWFGHTVTLYDELVRVPLVIAGPGIPSGAVLGESVSTRELGSALAELAGVHGVEPTGIVALLRGSPIPVRTPIVCEVDYEDAHDRQPQARMRAIVRGDHKLIVDELADRVQLFDLARDPGERNDLAAHRPDLVRELSSELDELLSRGPDSAPETRELDAEELEELRGLGYAGSDE